VCRGVDVHYDGTQVLFGVDLDVDEGELVALLGTNGAGKSTLLRAISGVTEPSGGAVFFDGHDTTHAPPHELARAGVVQMPGGKGVFPTLTVADNLRVAAWSLTPNEAESRVGEVYAFFPRLAERRSTLAGALSGGEQQMVALGQAMVMKPRMLLIDELSLGLAPAVVEQLLQAVTALHAAGTTIVLVEQSVDLALSVARRAIFMEKGEVRFDGSAQELREQPGLLRSVYLGGTRRASAAPRTKAPAHTAAPVVLEVADVSVRYGGIKALDGAGLSVRAGEVVGLIGPNGAGKTTLFDAVCGFVPLERGRVVVSGHDVTHEPPRSRVVRGLARSFQDARLFPALTVADNLLLALQREGGLDSSAVMAALWTPQARRTEAQLRRRADAVIDAFGLGACRDKVPGELSTGTRRIVDIALQMASEPEVLLLDEPSAGIAQAEAEELVPLLDRVRRELGCGLLVIEHDMSLLTSLCDRMVGMVLGQTLVEGTVVEVTSDSRMVAAYLGTSDRVLSRSATPATHQERPS
jgi:branched-chain amino acid transport system ATP-binding protein